MPTINELQDEIIEEFSALDDWMDRYALIIDLGNTLEPLPESDKTPNNIIEGCQSRVWITAHFDGERVHFQGESDAIIVRVSSASCCVSSMIRATGHPRPPTCTHQGDRSLRAPLPYALQRARLDAPSDASLRSYLRQPKLSIYFTLSHASITPFTEVACRVLSSPPCGRLLPAGLLLEDYGQ